MYIYRNIHRNTFEEFLRIQEVTLLLEKKKSQRIFNNIRIMTSESMIKDCNHAISWLWKIANNLQRISTIPRNLLKLQIAKK